MKLSILKKLYHGYIWKRIFYEKITEPLHLNLISLFVFLFGSLKLKIAFDLVLRLPYAYSILESAERAKKLGLKKISIIEFGVANGAGLKNMQDLARKITKITSIEIDVYGFDTGKGMPPPQSFKDHPELYQEGDFEMNIQLLKSKLNDNTKLIIGEINSTIKEFIKKDFSDAPIAFLNIDVDYYSSSVDCLEVLKIPANQLMPSVIIYLDDLEDYTHNSWCGELAAVNEFTKNNLKRPIERHYFFKSQRIMKNARWIDHIFQCHVLDHSIRNKLNTHRTKINLDNFY